MQAQQKVKLLGYFFFFLFSSIWEGKEDILVLPLSWEDLWLVLSLHLGCWVKHSTRISHHDPCSVMLRKTPSPSDHLLCCATTCCFLLQVVDSKSIHNPKPLELLQMVSPPGGLGNLGEIAHAVKMAWDGVAMMG